MKTLILCHILDGDFTTKFNARDTVNAYLSNLSSSYKTIYNDQVSVGSIPPLEQVKAFILQINTKTDELCEDLGDEAETAVANMVDGIFGVIPDDIKKILKKINPLLKEMDSETFFFLFHTGNQTCKIHILIQKCANVSKKKCTFSCVV